MRTVDIIPAPEKAYFERKFRKHSEGLLGISISPAPTHQTGVQSDLEDIRTTQKKTTEFFANITGPLLLFTTESRSALIGGTPENQIRALIWEDHGGVLSQITTQTIESSLPINQLIEWGPKSLKLSYKGEITFRKNPTQP